jgi:uncharacterized phage-like protein YoqJ
MILEEKTVCFTGHRKIPPEKSKDISRRLTETLIQLIDDGYVFFGAGGALGFDTLAAQTILDLKSLYPQIKLILVFPCKNQSARWSDEDKKLYEYIKVQADKVVYTSEMYSRGCMHKRNRHLVDHSSVCVCYLTEDTGGTAYTVKYAAAKGIRIVNVAEN